MSKPRPLYIRHAGPTLLETPLLNKGSAFSHEEREQFNLLGLIPGVTETIDEQKERAYTLLQSFGSNFDKHLYLRSLQDTNETLYYRLLVEYLEEIAPIIYTPTVAEACRQFSQIYRRHRGLFISYPQMEHMDDMLRSVTKKNVKAIVVTDGERIQGLGDLGVGGMGIAIGKLCMYVACGGISPAYTLPVVLDAGCNNETLLNDPLYMGWRHPRITGIEYEEFVDEFVDACKRRWPNALIQFEDFAKHNATWLLQRYRDNTCCFNDDIQGTAAVTLGTLISACESKGEKLKDQCVVIAGAGSAGCSIAQKIILQMQNEGLTGIQARDRVYILDRHGLLLDNRPDLQEFQERLTKPAKLIKHWKIEKGETISLLDVIQNTQPSVLIGVSGKANLFDKEAVTAMQSYEDTPIILPLSNPTSQTEATPEDLLNWTQGKALIATGSPFPAVEINGESIAVSQCNTAYVFPGVALGVIASGATTITETMFLAASQVLAMHSPRATKDNRRLLPPYHSIRELSKKIAKAVYQQAITDGVTMTVSEEVIDRAIAQNFWTPAYRQYRRIAY